MASRKQRRTTRKNIKKAVKAAKREQTLKHYQKEPAKLSEGRQPKSGTHKGEIGLLSALILAEDVTAVLG